MMLMNPRMDSIARMFTNAFDTRFSLQGLSTSFLGMIFYGRDVYKFILWQGFKAGESLNFMSYEFLEHTADVKFRAEGSNIEEMFSSAADALNETIRGDIKILDQFEKSFEIDGKDNEELLYNFLEEFLFLLDAQSFLVARIKSISIGDGKLECVVVGDDVDNYKFTNDVKAVTYSEMKVEEKKGKFVCEVVLDV